MGQDRLAIGAPPGQVCMLVLKRGVAQIGVGLALGLAALASGRPMRRMLVGIEPGDPLTLAAVTGFLVIVAIAACLLPARRAAQTDPLTALRAE